MIRKLKSGEYRIYSRKVDPKTGKRRNLGTFDSLEAAKKHEKEIQYFKHHWGRWYRMPDAVNLNFVAPSNKAPRNPARTERYVRAGKKQASNKENQIGEKIK